MKLKKLLAGFMAACMVATAVPVTAMACEPVDVEVEEDYGIMLLEEVDETADDVLTIARKDDLLAFAKDAKEGDNYSGKTVELTADIDFGWDEWEAITFYGTFEGNGHTISNLTYTPTSSGRMGFFQSLGGPAKDLTLNNIKATVTNDYADGARVAGFARYLNAAVENIHVNNITITTKNTLDWVGGFTTYTAGGRTDNCSVTNLTVNAENGADLIAGFITLTSNRQLYENSTVNGFKVTVTDTHSSGCGVGGFVAQTQTGWNNPKFKNDVVEGIDITATGLVDVGGFIAWPGAHTEYAKNCTTQGKIDVTGVTSANCFAGGFFGNLGWNCDLGYQGHKITDCTADVDITTTDAAAGGFVGSATNSNNNSMYAEFTNCTANGDITSNGDAPVGGFAGDADRGVYTDCSATGEVKGTGYVGGFIGHLMDVTPKYDHRYPKGTRDYLADEITAYGCEGSSDLFGAVDKTAGLIGYIDDGTDITLFGNAYDGKQYNPVTGVEEEVTAPMVAVTDSDDNVTLYDTLQKAMEDVNKLSGKVLVELADGEHVTNFKITDAKKNITIKGSEDAVLKGQIATTSGNAGTLTLEGVTVMVDGSIVDSTGISQTGKSAIALWGNQTVICKDVTFDMSLTNSTAITSWWDTGVGTTIECYDCTFNCNGQRPIRATGNVTVERCTFNDPYRYAVQLTAKSSTATEMEYAVVNFNNNTIVNGANGKDFVYGIQLEGSDYGCHELQINAAGNKIEGAENAGNAMIYNEEGKVEAESVYWNVDVMPVYANGATTVVLNHKLGEIYLRTLAEAVAAAEEDDTITLLEEVTDEAVNNATVTIAAGETLNVLANGAIELPVGSAVTDKDGETFALPYGGILNADGTVTAYAAPVAPSTSNGGSTSKSYKAEINTDDIENGSISLSRTKAKSGTEVTITATPDKGYVLDELKVLNSRGTEIDVTDNGDGTFTFKMPKGGVDIEASFVEGEAEVPAVDEKEEILVLTIDQVIYQLNGSYEVNDVAPIIQGDRTFLPIRLIAEFLGATVTWSEADQSVTIVKGDTTIVIYIGEAFALVNGEPVQLDAPAFIANDRTYLPLRFVAENLGAVVTWDGTARTVTVIG